MLKVEISFHDMLVTKLKHDIRELETITHKRYSTQANIFKAIENI